MNIISVDAGVLTNQEVWLAIRQRRQERQHQPPHYQPVVPPHSVLEMEQCVLAALHAEAHFYAENRKLERDGQEAMQEFLTAFYALSPNTLHAGSGVPSQQLSNLLNHRPTTHVDIAMCLQDRTEVQDDTFLEAVVELVKKHLAPQEKEIASKYIRSISDRHKAAETKGRTGYVLPLEKVMPAAEAIKKELVPPTSKQLSQTSFVTPQKLSAPTSSSQTSATEEDDEEENIDNEEILDG